jgi:hypothetical protein
MNLELFRYGSIPGIGTFGYLHADAQVFYTVEREWLDNEPFVSCLPAGGYHLVPHKSPKYGDCYCIINKAAGVYQWGSGVHVKRFACLFHAANWPTQVQGCVGIGQDIYHIDGKLGVTNSRQSMAKLKKLLGSNTHRLDIKWIHL